MSEVIEILRRSREENRLRPRKEKRSQISLKDAVAVIAAKKCCDHDERAIAKAYDIPVYVVAELCRGAMMPNALQSYIRMPESRKERLGKKLPQRKK